MSLSVIKEQINKNQELLKRELPVDSKFHPSYYMSINEATIKLEQLFLELEKELKKKVRLNFVKLTDQTKNLLNKSEFVLDHRSLAKEMVKVTLSSLPPNTELSSFQIANLNNRMKEICLELGVNSQICPDLYMDSEFQRIVSSEEHFVNIVESMIEKMVKNRDFDEEGHVLQALYVTKTFLKKAPNLINDNNDIIDLYILVPKITKSLVEEYKNHFSNNVRTIGISERADLVLQNYEELLTLVIGNNIVKKSKKK